LRAGLSSSLHSLQVKLIGHSFPSQEENIARLVGATSSDGFVAGLSRVASRSKSGCTAVVLLLDGHYSLLILTTCNSTTVPTRPKLFH